MLPMFTKFCIDGYFNTSTHSQQAVKSCDIKSLSDKIHMCFTTTWAAINKAYSYLGCYKAYIKPQQTHYQKDKTFIDINT